MDTALGMIRSGPDVPRESFREEASMTIAHSVLSVSFGRKVRCPAAEQIHDAAAVPAAPSPTGMTCSPWEGLYVEGVESQSVVEAAAPNPELERFLSSLFPGNGSKSAPATDAPPSKKVAVVITRALSVTRTDAEGSTLIEKICDSSLEAGECFFCTGPETD